MVEITETNHTTSHVLERTTQRTSWAQTNVPFVGRKAIFRLTALSIGDNERPKRKKGKERAYVAYTGITRTPMTRRRIIDAKIKDAGI